MKTNKVSKGTSQDTVFSERGFVIDTVADSLDANRDQINELKEQLSKLEVKLTNTEQFLSTFCLAACVVFVISLVFMCLAIQRASKDAESVKLRLDQMEQEEKTAIPDEYYTYNEFEGHREFFYDYPEDAVIARANQVFGNLNYKYAVRDDGVKTYGGYVIVAANYDVHPYGSIVLTSKGEGIVLETGTLLVDEPSRIDIAVEMD